MSPFCKRGDFISKEYFEDNLIETIKIIVESYCDRFKKVDYPSVVKNIVKDKVEVEINGSNYLIKNGIGINLKIGSAIWVHCPNGNINDAYISALR